MCKHQMDEPLNSYRKEIDLYPLQRYCLSNRKELSMPRGATFQQSGAPSRHIAYIEKGCFKYTVHNHADGKDYITGFAFEGEFVADYPNCLYGLTSKVQIEANTEAKIYIVNGEDMYKVLMADTTHLLYGLKIIEGLFLQIYSNYIDLYSHDARERYKHLLKRCPQIVQQLNLKDIASYLKLHPNTISKIRHDITFEGQQP